MSLSVEPLGPSIIAIYHGTLASDQPVDRKEEPEDAEVLLEDPEGADVDGEVAQGEVQPGEEEAGEAPRCLPCPGVPSAAERLAHELVHWPYRPWCQRCVRGRAVGPNSKKVPAANRESIVPRALLGYTYLQDEVVEDGELSTSDVVKLSMTILIMFEMLCESVWERGSGQEIRIGRLVAEELIDGRCWQHQDHRQGGHGAGDH